MPTCTRHSSPQRPLRPRLRSGKTGSIIVYLLILLAFGVAIGLWAVAGRDGAGAGENSPDLFVVQKGAFDITIPAMGDLAALKQVEIRNQLESRAVITYIVPEGATVKTGEILIRLNDEEIQTRIDEAEEAVNSAENALQNAIANLENRKSVRESELAQANLNIELAALALEGWAKGEVVSRRNTLRIDIETAEKDEVRLRERYEDSVKLHEKGFISEDELRSDEISWIRAEAQLRESRLAETVYNEYTYKQEEKQKNSDLEQAQQERDRLENRLSAEVVSAESDLESARRSLEIRQERLDKLLKQLESCVIEAPSAGLVVYASSLDRDGWGRNDGQPPQVGTELSRNEPVLVLPDTSQMVAAVKVNEALMGQIQPGQTATIRSDALPNVVLRGEVIGIGVLAEGGGWRDPNRRDYTVRVKLLNVDETKGLKPSMRAQASINVGRVENALYVPVQAVLRKGPLAFVYVPQDGGFAQRKVALGRSSELYVEVVEGLAAGDRVLLREPRIEEVTSELDLPPHRDSVDKEDELVVMEPPQRPWQPGGPRRDDSAARSDSENDTDRSRRPGDLASDSDGQVEGAGESNGEGAQDEGDADAQPRHEQPERRPGAGRPERRGGGGGAAGGNN